MEQNNHKSFSTEVKAERYYKFNCVACIQMFSFLIINFLCQTSGFNHFYLRSRAESLLQAHYKPLSFGAFKITQQKGHSKLENSLI
jgi:hypothetical protein